jgi:hypothetical protein
MPLATWAAALILATLADPAPAPTPAPVASAAPVKDERALALLRKMSDRLQGAKSFTFKARTSREVLVNNGVQATFFNDLRVALQRPDKVAANRTGDLPEFRFAYDGKAMTAYAPGKREWATTAAPPTIDAMIFAAYEQAKLSFPADEVLVADPFAAMTKDLTSIELVGRTTIAGRKTDHVVLANPSMEVQVWLDVKTGLPVESAVVYLDDPRKPHFYIEYLDWRLDPKLPASTFALPKPSGAAQVDFSAIANAAQ